MALAQPTRSHWTATNTAIRAIPATLQERGIEAKPDTADGP
ncbi:hypothetical protein SynBIOSU31_01968 [Synechococcus sp. BIOS-U3-1]|nr:hypothetical protein SynBIOSU31_01968 [Synechococcus sp. BIOS-U3-1]